MTKNQKWSVVACSFFAICVTASFLYLVTHSGGRMPASDNSMMTSPRWSESGSSKAAPFYGGQY